MRYWNYKCILCQPVRIRSKHHYSRFSKV